MSDGLTLDDIDKMIITGADYPVGPLKILDIVN